MQSPYQTKKPKKCLSFLYFYHYIPTRHGQYQTGMYICNVLNETSWCTEVLLPTQSYPPMDAAGPVPAPGTWGTAWLGATHLLLLRLCQLWHILLPALWDTHVCPAHTSLHTTICSGEQLKTHLKSQKINATVKKTDCHQKPSEITTHCYILCALKERERKPLGLHEQIEPNRLFK